MENFHSARYDCICVQAQNTNSWFKLHYTDKPQIYNYQH